MSIEAENDRVDRINQIEAQCSFRDFFRGKRVSGMEDVFHRRPYHTKI